MKNIKLICLLIFYIVFMFLISVNKDFIDIVIIGFSGIVTSIVYLIIFIIDNDKKSLNLNNPTFNIDEVKMNRGNGDE